MSVFALGIELDGEGSHPAAWRRAHHPQSEALSGRTLAQKVRAAENAGFTLATFDDSIVPPQAGLRARVDAVNRASFVAAATSTIGLVPVVETTYAEPFHTSSQLATLDYTSRGRGGWIATRVAHPAAARAWGRTALTDQSDLDREQRDSITVVRDLWDSWEDDAVVRDYASGRFLDRDKLHYVDFQGETFTVKGPAIVPRPPQGQLVVFGTEADRELVDVVLVSEPNGDLAVDTASRSDGLTFIEIAVTLDTPGTSATERLAALDEHERARSSRLAYAGPATGFVELLTELAAHTDGVRLFPTVIDEDLPVLARYVLPALFKSGVAHRPVPGSSLRGNLGLSRPANRHARV
ncbi:LLM class flavin-dependent oxidoreductase [Mycobacterium sp. AZCC_0083]|uniref:LLM class flavin-dependent oxidoreductase n=1 Tax=Mycobacterium sp. AZCC_0083 TaxID=2735882 RepID=UPI00160C092B|nr:LLM class flavin-dependent oxidoreductase [Mycobacterium sp. AZCC_0083]MBB5163924.1 alkanesulfonate monooxygenase SsuD/methylene tetrahydromethanopterin reductase-like flavin-dependent oxidoreductase (luciferase family) [Mycobacterium sp. AZCC_0083]